MRVKKSKDMKKFFTHGQRIRHRIGINKIWTGAYDSSRNGIVCDDIFYDSISPFAKNHNKVELPHRLSNTANGWRECECEVDGKWVSADSLRG